MQRIIGFIHDYAAAHPNRTLAGMIAAAVILLVLVVLTIVTAARRKKKAAGESDPAADGTAAKKKSKGPVIVLLVLIILLLLITAFALYCIYGYRPDIGGYRDDGSSSGLSYGSSMVSDTASGSSASADDRDAGPVGAQIPYDGRSEIRMADRVGDFSEGYATYKTAEGLYGYFNKNGQIIAKARYERAGDFQDGYAVVRRNGLYGVIDTQGCEVIPCSCRELSGSGIPGVWRATLQDDSLVLIRADGTKSAEPYDSLYAFSEGLAFAVKGAEQGCIDETERFVFTLPAEWTWCGSFKDGFARLRGTENGKCVVARVDTTGVISDRVVLTKYMYPEFNEENGLIYTYKEGTGDLQGSTLLAVYDGKTGEEISASFRLEGGSRKVPIAVLEQSIDTSRIGEGLLPVMLNHPEGTGEYRQTMCYLDANTLALSVIPGSDNWSEAEAFVKGHAIVRTCGTGELNLLDYDKNGKYGLVSQKGYYTFEPKYEGMRYLGGGLYAVKSDGKWGVLVTDGSMFDWVNFTGYGVFALDSVTSVADNFLKICIDGKYGLMVCVMNKGAIQAAMQLGTAYDEIRELYDGVFMVKQNGAWSQISIMGKKIW